MEKSILVGKKKRHSKWNFWVVASLSSVPRENKWKKGDALDSEKRKNIQYNVVIKLDVEVVLNAKKRSFYSDSNSGNLWH